MRRAAVAVVLMAMLAGCGGVPPPPGPVTVGGARDQHLRPKPSQKPTSQPAPRVSPSFDAARAFRDLRFEAAIGPRPAGSAADRRDARFIAGRLQAAGVSGVRIQHPYLNVVGRIPGSKPGTVVVGAHHDTKDVPGFVGANDGASGVAVVLELARALGPRTTGPSIAFALFDAEESPGVGNGVRAFERAGHRGSGQYVRYAGTATQGSAPLRSIRAMVLFDLVGDCGLRIPHEASSDPRLYEFFAQAAARGGAATPFRGESGGVLDDHTPFERAGIPAVDLIDFHYGPGPPPGAWFHTTKDNLAHVCPRSLGQVGEAAVTAVPAIR